MAYAVTLEAHMRQCDNGRKCGEPVVVGHSFVRIFKTTKSVDRLERVAREVVNLLAYSV